MAEKCPKCGEWMRAIEDWEPQSKDPIADHIRLAYCWRCAWVYYMLDTDGDWRRVDNFKIDFSAM